MSDYTEARQQYDEMQAQKELREKYQALLKEHETLKQGYNDLRDRHELMAQESLDNGKAFLSKAAQLRLLQERNDELETILHEAKAVAELVQQLDRGLKNRAVHVDALIRRINCLK